MIDEDCLADSIRPIGVGWPVVLQVVLEIIREHEPKVPNRVANILLEHRLRIDEWAVGGD